MALGGGGKSSAQASGSHGVATAHSTANANGFSPNPLRLGDGILVNGTRGSISSQGYRLLVIVDRGLQLTAAETARCRQGKAHLRTGQHITHQAGIKRLSLYRHFGDARMYDALVAHLQPTLAALLQ